jgi:hypothetical protein
LQKITDLKQIFAKDHGFEANSCKRSRLQIQHPEKNTLSIKNSAVLHTSKCKTSKLRTLNPTQTNSTLNFPHPTYQTPISETRTC